MTLEDMRSKKAELGLTNEMIAQTSGIPLSTIQKVFSGTTRAPRKSTLIAIETVLFTEESRRRELAIYQHVKNGAEARDGSEEKPSYFLERQEPYSFKEAAVTYGRTDDHQKTDGEYTLEDYYALPDERRVELIDGVFYDMAAPAIIHQKILGELYILFRECVDSHDRECEVYLSPCDVRLDMDNKTMVQPDLFMICRDYDISAKAIDGAPELTVEILSPSTRAKDMFLKLYKYKNAGVKEYWIIDPEKDTVFVYDLRSDDSCPEKYDFNSEIPICISDGQCTIDFSRVYRALEKVRKK
ncbi:MAG: Uma2 family endonuclease [Lachnospiraceae bacterium]|nr:Uma2 family endonuclease [Lachnospiraceae bacterium]